MIEAKNISQYIGIPFVDRGRSMAGCDCYGLIYQFYKKEYGISLPLLDSYETTEDAQAISQIVAGEKANWTKIVQPEPGDVVVLKLMGRETHVGIYIGKNRMLHAFKGTDSCIEPLHAPQWKNRVEGYYRYD